MEKLERYLEQVCRSMGGPRSMRQHLRQELREHLLDLASQHQASGLSEAAALDRALEDFGGPDELRSGLEATYGHRLLPVVIDKAMQWKERTMRAKWLWATWAHLAVATVIVLEVMWITFATIFLIPKFQKLLHDGLIDPAVLRDQSVAWMASFLSRVSDFGGHYTTWLLLSAICACGLFEWRVRGENKTLIRLSAWGSVAIFLLIVGILVGASMIIPFELGAPQLGRIVGDHASQELILADGTMSSLEKALAQKTATQINWELIDEQAGRAAQALDLLVVVGPGLGSLFPQSAPTELQELRLQLGLAKVSLLELQRTARDKDAIRAGNELQKASNLIRPIKRAATIHRLGGQPTKLNPDNPS